MHLRGESRRVLAVVIAFALAVSLLSLRRPTSSRPPVTSTHTTVSRPPRRAVPLLEMTGAEHIARLRKITVGREFYAKKEYALTQSPLAQGVEPCPPRPSSPPGLKHTGKRALVLYSITHRDQGPVHSMEMDNFAFFAQHGLFPSSLRTALFTQVDYVVVRVAASDGVVHDYTEGLMDTNVRMLILPFGPCDICSTARTLRYLGVNHTNSMYSYVVSMNSGSRGPFFTMPPGKNKLREPYTWIDHMALGGEDQFHDDVITASAASLQWITHFQTYAFGLPTAALKGMGPFFADTCTFPNKDGCIYLGELLSARTAFKFGLRVRSLIHDPERSYGDEESFTRAINATDLPSPLVSSIVKPCQMLFVKFGGDTFQNSWFQSQYVQTLLAHSIAQTLVANRLPISEDSTNLFGRAYFGHPLISRKKLKPY